MAEASDGAAREAAAARTLEQLDEANWSAPLPPVVVVTTDSGETTAMTVPVDRLPQTLHGRVELEGNAGSITSEFETAELPIVEQRVVRGVERRRLRLRLAGVPRLSPLCMDRSRWRSHVTTMLIVCPRQCYRPDEVRRGLRLWGPGCSCMRFARGHR